MSIFVFSKGIATISTIGGALLGGYFATTSLDKGNTEQLEVTEVGHSGNSSLGEDGLVSPKQQDVEENKQGAAEVQATPIIQENDSSEVTESKNNELNEPQQDSQVSENVDSESSGGDYQQDSGIQESQDIQLTDPTLVEALRDTKDYTTSSNNDEEEQDQKDLDSGEQFEDFEEDEEDIFDDEDDVESSLIMAEYIKTWSENSDSSKARPYSSKMN
ncbi:hypothetical protein [Mycoplasma suis]|uniref:Uncharacterized protein n=1 Tax=Mycoplasma suis (strain Illinois) TaxID=768700 RepID=F0QQL9_MYCSL|nr:hypothetical protein [Mycoplasma suis]ADX97789.1 hypothetical protein MSU_0245 [Mycoplasma suis str. Illinois]